MTAPSIHRSCPVCASATANSLWRKGDLRLVRCADCGMVYANPIPAEMASGKFYDDAGKDYYLSPAKLESDYADVRFDRELRLFRKHCPRGTVLDVGCSSGAFLFQLRKRWPGEYEILGTDVSGAPLDYAESRDVPVARGDFLQMDFARTSAAQLPEAPHPGPGQEPLLSQASATLSSPSAGEEREGRGVVGLSGAKREPRKLTDSLPVRRRESGRRSGDGFDAITLWAVAEHLAEPKQFLEKAYAVLKPGGLCFVLVPNFKSLAVRLLGVKYRYVYAQHLNYFTARTLTALCAAKFEVVATRFMHFNPVVIWQDGRGGGRDVSNAERGELLKRTTAYKQQPWMKPVKWAYGAVENALAAFGLADNLVLVLRKRS